MMYLKKGLRLFFGEKEFLKRITEIRQGLKPDLLIAREIAATIIYLNSAGISPLKLVFNYSRVDGRPKAPHLNPTDTDLIYTYLRLVKINVTDYAIELPRVEMAHELTTTEQLQQHIPMIWLQAFRRQLFSAIGASDVPLLAPPVYVISQMYSGFKSVSKNPSNMNPNKFFATSVGTCAEAVDKFSKGITRPITFTMGEDYKKKRRQEPKAKSAKEGFKHGGKALGMSVFDGVTGIVMDPVRGAQQDGLKGFGKGIGKGLVGVVAKPVVGSLDLVSKTSEGISVSANPSMIGPGRRRVPRFFDETGAVLPYTDNKDKAIAHLKLVTAFSHLHDQTFVKHWETKKKTLILTKERIACIHSSTARHNWELPLSKLDPGDISVKQLPDRYQLAIGGKTITVPDQNEAMTWCTQIQGYLKGLDIATASLPQ